MTDAPQSVPTHEDLIREVFIDPIRTVVVIDDEYPTLDALVAKELKKEEPSWKIEDLERVQKILAFARTKERPWLVDVHDAKRIRAEAETRIAPYLDHSDLMVLDYHLDGDGGSGDASIKILRQLAHNGHHNLVVLYTKGYPGDAERVLREIGVGLTHPDADLGSDSGRMANVAFAVDQWEDAELGVRARLRDQVSSDIYLRHRKDRSYRSFLATSEAQGLKAALEGKPNGLVIHLGDLVDWLFLERQEALQEQFSSADLGPIQFGRTPQVSWLRTERLFVTVVPKTDPPEVFESRLTAALVHSFPGPHQLLLAKMRAALDDQGSHAEVAILGDRAVQSAWLDDFLNPNPSDESSATLSVISRHWEALGDQLHGPLHAFSVKVRSSFVPLGRGDVFERCGLDPKALSTNASVLSYNRFISTKRFDRSHLTTGHVFSMATSRDLQLGELWVCLSPACDMVPGQKDTGWNARLGSMLPFMAAKLFPVTDQTAAGAATSNNFLFLEIDGVTSAYSMYPQQGNVGHSPEWEQMFVANYGRFDASLKVCISTTRMTDKGLIALSTDAVVVAQLRAEYALNLLQRMGSFLFRPGLGMHFKKRA